MQWRTDEHAKAKDDKGGAHWDDKEVAQDEVRRKFLEVEEDEGQSEQLSRDGDGGEIPAITQQPVLHVEQIANPLLEQHDANDGTIRKLKADVV